MFLQSLDIAENNLSETIKMVVEAVTDLKLEGEIVIPIHPRLHWKGDEGSFFKGVQTDIKNKENFSISHASCILHQAFCSNRW